MQLMSLPASQATVDLQQYIPQQIFGLLSKSPGQLVYTVGQIWQVMPIFIISAALLRALLALLQWYLWEKTSELIAREMRSDLVRTFLQMSADERRDQLDAVDKEISAAIGTDIRMVREYLVHFLGGFPRELVQVIFYIVTLFVLNWHLALFFLCGIGPLGFIVSNLGKKLRKKSLKALDGNSLLVEWLQQRFAGIETIKHFVSENLEIQNLEKKVQILNKLYVSTAKVKARTAPIMEFLAVIVMALLLLYALRQIAEGAMSSSTLLSFFAVLGVLSQSASKLGRYYNSNKEGESALNRLSRVLRTMCSSKEEVNSSLIFSNIEAEWILNAENLSYTYPSSDTFALKEINWKLSPKKIYAIAGPSGSGKSTFLKILLGLWKIQSGSLRINLPSYKDIGYLPQTYRLFPGTIAQNLSYPYEEEEEDEMWKALAKVGLLEFVKSRTTGLKTHVGEGGLSLSGGQAQRLGLARLIYHRSRLIVIDEGTSALDPEMEVLTLRSLRELVETFGSTVIMVAHRLTALQSADEVMVLKAGQEVFKGEVPELFRGDLWKKLFETDSQ